jgi:hypothetical protein
MNCPASKQKQVWLWHSVLGEEQDMFPYHMNYFYFRSTDFPRGVENISNLISSSNTIGIHINANLRNSKCSSVTITSQRQSKSFYKCRFLQALTRQNNLNVLEIIIGGQIIRNQISNRFFVCLNLKNRFFRLIVLFR